MLFEDEVSLKDYLYDEYCIKFGDTVSNNNFIVGFYDNKGCTYISKGIYSTPIVAIRDLATIIKSTKLPVEDIDIRLLACFEDDDNFICNTIRYDNEDGSAEYVVLSPYLYYQKKEVSTDESSKNESEE